MKMSLHNESTHFRKANSRMFAMNTVHNCLVLKRFYILFEQVKLEKF